jgi:hypothetical protein
MNNFTIKFNASKRMDEIMNAALSLDARFKKLENRNPRSAEEALAIAEEQINIARQLNDLKRESNEIVEAKLGELFGNIERLKES